MKMNPMYKLLNSTFIKSVRIAALFCCVIWLLVPLFVTMLAYAQGQNPRHASDDTLTRQYLQDIQNEHRFSVLETKISAIDDKTSFMQNTMWGLIIGMSGLLGERGITLIRERKKEPNGDDQNA